MKLLYTWLTCHYEITFHQIDWSQVCLKEQKSELIITSTEVRETFIDFPAVSGV